MCALKLNCSNVLAVAFAQKYVCAKFSCFTVCRTLLLGLAMWPLLFKLQKSKAPEDNPILEIQIVEQ